MGNASTLTTHNGSIVVWYVMVFQSTLEVVAKSIIVFSLPSTTIENIFGDTCINVVCLTIDNVNIFTNSIFTCLTFFIHSFIWVANHFWEIQEKRRRSILSNCWQKANSNSYIFEKERMLFSNKQTELNVQTHWQTE